MKVSCLHGSTLSSLVLTSLCFLGNGLSTFASCAPVSSGVVSWWRAEENPDDSSGMITGTLAGNATYAAGRVGMAFAFDGSGDAVQLGNPAFLQLQDFSIEGWIRRTSASAVSGNGDALFLGYGPGGYGFGLTASGSSLFLTRVEVSAVVVGNSITDTNWHHVAVTKEGARVVFYVDGLAMLAAPYDPGFTFGSSVAIGARGDNHAASFLGQIDELAIYARALNTAEVQAIYTASSTGKCLFPAIFAQPADQTNFVGNTATLSISAGGARPLSFQWFFNGSSLAGTTNAVLLLPSLQLTQAGDYTVTITNDFGSTDSAAAHLTVLLPPTCAPLATNLISWWRGNGNALDFVSHNDGTLAGNTTYAAGQVGPAFAFDGTGDAVQLGNPTFLHLQNFSIEGWVRRTSTSAVSGGGDALFLGYGSGGYGFGLTASGSSLFLTRVEVSAVGVTNSITDTNWHHVAVTKGGADVMFYLDGLAIPAAPYDPGFTFGASVAIGARGDNLAASFLGLIDELTIYARVLTTAEVGAIYDANAGGKCLGSVPPFFIAMPLSQSTFVGSNVTFNVTAAGSLPLGYQWRFNDTNLVGATNATLSLTNLQLNQAGNYSVVVSNAGGVSVTSNAQLTLIYPPAAIRIANLSAISGGPVTVPILLIANGNENALTFSLNFNTQWLTFSGVTVGNGAANASLFPNTSQASSGRLGVALALPAGGLFAAGTQEVARVTFTSAIWLGAVATETSVRFGDLPWTRWLADWQDVPLLADYADGVVSLLATELEGDITPRTNGNRAVNIVDYVAAGRMAARLDFPAPGFEFQRADCAPRATKGDGQIKVTDWVQVGRYFFSLDPLTGIGGSATETELTAGPFGGPREFRVADAWTVPAGTITVPVNVQAQGDENADSFSLAFDPVKFSYLSVERGLDASSATLHVNTSLLGSGKLGVAFALPPGSGLAAGTRELLKLTLAVNASAPVTLTVGFGDQPVPRVASDLSANELSASYYAGSVTVNASPHLSIAPAGPNVALSWPAWAADFALQSSTNFVIAGYWSNVLAGLQTNGANVVVTLPTTNETRFFRLRHP